MIVTCSSFFTDPPNLIAIARILFDSSESDRQFNASLTVLRLHWKIASSFFLISVSAKIFAIFNI
jgi:hypothetical protein